MTEEVITISRKKYELMKEELNIVSDGDLISDIKAAHKELKEGKTKLIEELFEECDLI